jgi:hypothetical protein
LLLTGSKTYSYRILFDIGILSNCNKPHFKRKKEGRKEGRVNVEESVNDLTEGDETLKLVLGGGGGLVAYRNVTLLLSAVGLR